MSLNNNALVSEETKTRKFQLVLNDLYEYPANRTVKALSTCPSAAEIRVVKAHKSSGDQFVFETVIGKTQFLSNVIKLHYKIPFIVKPTAWPKVGGTNVVITEGNFMKEIFSEGIDIVLAQQGIAQGENFLSVSLNSQALNPITEIAALTNITSPYYDTDDVYEYLQASQPDRFQTFARYDDDAPKDFTFLNEHCEKVHTTVAPLNEQNIFSSKYQAGYSSRTPQWKFIESKHGEHIKVTGTFWSYIRFSIGATPNNESSISGIDQFAVTTRLANNLAARIFNTKKISGVNRYAEIVQDNGDSDNTDAWMCLKITSPPQYVRESMTDPKTGLMKPYSIGCPRIECKMFNTYNVAPGATQKFNQEGIMLGSVPRSIYIALLKEREGSFQKVSETPVNFGLVSNLNISFESVNTPFQDQMSLDLLTNSNGYDELDPVGKLIKGYPIKLNLGKDISLPKDLVVGASGSYNLAISGNFYNQGETTEKYRLYIVMVHDDTIDFDGTRFSQSSGVYVPANLLNEAYFLRDLFHEQQKELNVLGGGKFGDAVKWVVKNTAKLAKNAWENRDKIAGTVGDVMAIAKTLKGGKLANVNTSGAGSKTVSLGAGEVNRSVFK